MLLTQIMFYTSFRPSLNGLSLLFHDIDATHLKIYVTKKTRYLRCWWLEEGGG